MAEKITAEQLKSQKSDFVIIDVREADELKRNNRKFSSYAFGTINKKCKEKTN